jgi:RND family efflux transporter MFP subunit
MSGKRWIWIAAVAVIAVAVVLFFMPRNKDAAKSELQGAAVTTVTRGALTNALTVAGQFQAYQEVDLHAKVSGYIREIRVDIGDRVSAGEVLATLEVPELREQLEGTRAGVRHSQAEVEQASSEIERSKSAYAALHDAWQRLEAASKAQPGLIAEQELEDARARSDEAEAQLAAAKSGWQATQQQLSVSNAETHRVQDLSDYTRIVAPFKGVVTMRYADTGSLIQAGTTSDTQSMPVVRLAQSDVLRLRMPVPEADVPYIAVGGSVQVHVQATGREFTGKIVRFARSLDTSTRTMLTEVDVPNPDLTLSPGMYAETRIALEEKPDALSVPTGAVVREGDGASVLVVDGGNRIEKRAVTLGMETADRVEIASGLKEGERVITAGQSGFREGEVVAPHEAFVPKAVQEDNK